MRTTYGDYGSESSRRRRTGIRTLTSQLSALKQRHRDEVHQLRKALDAAQGEILELRRRLGHPRDIEPPHLPAQTDIPRHH